jgi:hypothetical protein
MPATRFQGLDEVSMKRGRAVGHLPRRCVLTLRVRFKYGSCDVRDAIFLKKTTVELKVFHKS